MTEDIKVHNCEGCGAEMLFDISAQALKCPFCDTVSDEQPAGEVVERDFSNPTSAEAQSRWQSSVDTLSCGSCGAEIIVQTSSTVARCAFCGSDHVLQSKQEAGIPPDGIIPFKIDKASAKERFVKWVRKLFWAPNKLKHLFQSDKMDAVYLPYWTFDAHVSCPYTAQGGKEYYVTVGSGNNRRTERRIRWYNVRGKIKHFFDDVLVNAQKTARSFISSLENFNTKEAKPFSDAYLAGFAAEKYTLYPMEASKIAEEKMRKALVDMAYAEVKRSYDEAQHIRISPTFSGLTFKHLLLPFWVTAFMYQNKLYYVAINGQTGMVHGEYPKSKAKIAVAVLLIIAVLAGLLYLGLRYG